MTSLSPAEQFLLLVARPHLTPDEVGRARHLAAGSAGAFSFAQVVELAYRHSVIPLVRHHLQTSLREIAPAGLIRALSAWYLPSLVRSLSQRQALPTLLDGLRHRGIETVVFKGPVLTELAYDDESCRLYGDLDLVVRSEDAARALDVLREAAFELKGIPEVPFHARWPYYTPLQNMHGNAVGLVRRGGASGNGAAKLGAVHVDLHWGLAPRYYRLPLTPTDLWDRRIAVDLGPPVGVVHTFTPEDTVLLLAIHGAKHGLNRLRYICDLAAWVRAHPRVDWDTVLGRARAFHCETMVLVSLRLAHQLLALPLPPCVAQQIEQRPSIQRTSDQAVGLLFGQPQGLRHALELLRFHVQVRDRRIDSYGSIAYTLHLLLRPTGEDRAWVRLPSSLSGLYYAVRPVRLVWMELRRLWSRDPHR